MSLDELLTEPECPRCRECRIRPVDVMAAHLTFECRRRCGWWGRAELPRIEKTIIYLDTSTVSYMAKALNRRETGSEWYRLYEALGKAAAEEVICCVGSPSLQAEAELHPLAEEIVHLSRSFADPSPRDEQTIREIQINRALNMYLRGDPPVLDCSPPVQEAFDEDVNLWTPMFHFVARVNRPQEWIERRRSIKARNRSDFERAYRQYADQGLTYEEVRRLESRGTGEGILLVGQKALRIRLGLERPQPEEDVIDYYLPTTFDMLVRRIQQGPGPSFAEAVAKATDFLVSEHVVKTPVADLHGRLHAGLAMRCRGTTPRAPRESDAADIGHIATYAPYVDVLIVDRFFKDLCNQREVHIGESYGCDIRTLRPSEVPEFIDWLRACEREAPHAALARKIKKAIQDGGHHQDFARWAEGYLKARGIEVGEQDNAEGPEQST